MALKSCSVVAVLVAIIISLTNITAVFSNKLSRFQEEDWKTFQQEHVLNPEEEPDYADWNEATWLQRVLARIPALEGTLRQKSQNRAHPSTYAGVRLTEVVVIAKPIEVLAAFAGSAKQHGVNNQAMIWSNRAFPTYVFQRHGSKVRGYDCGNMFITARLLNSVPVYLYDFYPIPIPNALGGAIRYPVSERCRRIPTSPFP